MMISNYVAWRIKTDEAWRLRWSKKVLDKTEGLLDYYGEQVTRHFDDSAKISELFWPVYERTIMARSNYSLIRDEVEENMARIANNPEYKLVWYETKEGSVLGGNVIRITKNMIKGVYRAYDREACAELGYREFDYYADYQLQKYVYELGYTEFSRGVIANPYFGLGLILFKLKTGGYPVVPRKHETRELELAQTYAKAKLCGACAVFSNPDSAGKLRRLDIYQNEGYNPELVQAVVKLSNRIGIIADKHNLGEI